MFFTILPTPIDIKQTYDLEEDKCEDQHAQRVHRIEHKEDPTDGAQVPTVREEPRVYQTATERTRIGHIKLIHSLVLALEQLLEYYSEVLLTLPLVS